MAKEKWIQKAVSKMKRKGTVGSLTRAAKKAGAYKGGKISLEYLQSLLKKGGKMAKKARFALAMRKIKR
ncbi:MAG: hypothetical protein QXV73_04545 [Candidatus Micrarchaeia archaeon]